MNIAKHHSFRVSVNKAIQIQYALKAKLIVRDSFKRLRLLAAGDVSFKDEEAKGAVCLFDYPSLKLKEKIICQRKISFPYIPGLFTFREGPVIISCFKKLKLKPDLILLDGQGIAHPRSMGLASHIGIILNIPTIGCAKTNLYGTYKEPENKIGAYSFIKDKIGNVIGACLRSRKDVKPIFVSCGHRVSLNTSIEIVLSCIRRYRIPYPLRIAHLLSKK